MPIIAIVIAVFVIVTGTTVVAESSLPGDSLYAVKVSFNEGLRSGIALTSKGQTEWDIRRAERRLEEVEKLIQKGTFSAEVGSEADVKFRTHVEAAKKGIAELRASGNIEAAASVSAKLESVLQAHAAILARIGSTKADIRAALALLLASVESEARVSGQLATDNASAFLSASSSETGMRSAAEASLKSAENKIAEVRSFIEKKTPDADTESATEANAKLQMSESSVASAKVSLEAGAYAEAFRLGRLSLKDAQEAKLLLEWGKVGKDGSLSSESSSSSATEQSSSMSSSEQSQESSSSSRSSIDTGLRVQAEAKIASAEKKIDEVRAFIAQQSSKLSVTVKAQAIAKVDAAAQLLLQARAKFGLNFYAESRDMADSSFRMAVEAQATVEKENQTKSSAASSTTNTEY